MNEYRTGEWKETCYLCDDVVSSQNALPFNLHLLRIWG
jgi:hypothetical protein